MKKQTIITVLFALVALTGRAQTFTPVVEDSINFVITGTTPSPGDSVYMWPCAPFGKDMNVVLRNGQFRVAGRLPRNTFFQICDDLGSLKFIVDSIPTHVNMATGEVRGSNVQQRFISYQLCERDIDRAEEQFMSGFSESEQKKIIRMSSGDLPIETALDSANVEKYNHFREAIKAIACQSIRENQDNVIPAWYFYLWSDKMKKAELDELLHKDAPYSQHPAMQRTWMYYWSLLQREAVEGQPFRDFTATDSLGTEHKLSDYAAHGQYILLDFWASWCSPCIASFPQMRQLYNTYKDRGLQIIGISIDKDRSAWLKALDRYKLPWLQLHSPDKTDGTATSDLYGVCAIPSTILIDRSGTVIGMIDNMEELKAKLKEVFNNKLIIDKK